MIRWVGARSIAGMVPWACSTTGADGLKYGLILYATDPEQIERDHRHVTVEGRLVATGDEE